VIEALVDRMTEPYRYMELRSNDIGWAARAVNRDGVTVNLVWQRPPDPGVRYIPVAVEGPITAMWPLA
jgi:hypothetical protein